MGAKIHDMKKELKYTAEFEHHLVKITTEIKNIINSSKLKSFNLVARESDGNKISFMANHFAHNFAELKEEVHKLIQELTAMHIPNAINLIERELKEDKGLVIIKEEHDEIEFIKGKLENMKGHLDQMEARLNELHEGMPEGKLDFNIVTNYIHLLVTNLVAMQNYLNHLKPELNILESDEREMLKEYQEIKELF